MMIESLETRRMLSATATVVQGCDGTNTLVVNMTSADAIQVTEVASELVVGNPTPQSNVVTAGFFKTGAAIGPGVWTNISHIVIQGSSGNDAIMVSAQNVDVNVEGGAGDDVILATGGAITDSLGNYVAPQTASFNIDGGDGNDVIEVINGLNDVIYGGNGNDTLFSASGTDQFIDGGNGADQILVGDTDSLVTGGNGKDVIAVLPVASGDPSYILPSNGKDTIDIVSTNSDPVVTQIVTAVNNAATAAFYG
ncbi:MAG TPA: hypothetical protein VFC78_03965 [Tepidisphaeraceae bacterium]|nr:hypothetical protein [Tepidisphaeraceae bacterium]